MIVVSICLSDIPENKRNVGKNGKVYASVVVDEKRNGADDWGNTHSVYMNQTKEERQARVDKIWVGQGKEFVFSGSRPARAHEDDGDLPVATPKPLPF